MFYKKTNTNTKNKTDVYKKEKIQYDFTTISN